MVPLAEIGIKRSIGGKFKRAALNLSGTELEVADNQVTVPAVGYREVVTLELG